MEKVITLTVPQASMLKCAAQVWLAGCNRSIHAGGHGQCAGHPALEAVVAAVREQFKED